MSELNVSLLASVLRQSSRAIGAIGALMNRVLQPRPLVVLGLNVWMGTDAGADELVDRERRRERTHQLACAPSSVEGVRCRVCVGCRA